MLTKRKGNIPPEVEGQSPQKRLLFGVGLFGCCKGGWRESRSDKILTSQKRPGTEPNQKVGEGGWPPRQAIPKGKDVDKEKP